MLVLGHKGSMGRSTIARNSAPTRFWLLMSRSALQTPPLKKPLNRLEVGGGITNTSYLIHKINRAFAVPPLPHLLHFNNGELSRFAIRAISLLFVFLLKRELKPKIKLISSNSQSDEILDFRPLRRGRELGSAKWTSGEGIAVAAEVSARV